LFYVHRYFATYRYYKNNKSIKLHLGAGSTVHDGWLGSDLVPKIGKGIIYIDASKRLPFKSNSIDFIYSEHMIEHISYESAKYMIKECNRVLKNKGRIRISTPDLDKYISLFDSNKTATQKEFIAFMNKNWLYKFSNDNTLPYHILNLNMHAWGHQYIYCKATLSEQLSSANFSQIKKYNNNNSSDPDFVDLEMHADNLGSQMGILNAVEMVDFETMNIEAEKE
jgi:predicted SAM-dependent methyltransferase